MTSERTTKNILIRYVIGSSILMLGLMAFSALCWWVCTSCAEENPLRSLGFWELLGVAVIASVSFIVVRSMRKRRNAMRDNLSDDDMPSYAQRLKRTQSNWRSLYAQLSRDEREKLKAMMEKYCSEPSTEAGSSNAEQWQDKNKLSSH